MGRLALPETRFVLEGDRLSRFELAFDIYPVAFLIGSHLAATIDMGPLLSFRLDGEVMDIGATTTVSLAVF